MTEGLSQAGGTIQAGDQVADSGDLGRLLSLHRKHAKKATERESDDQGQPDWTHLPLVSSRKPNFLLDCNGQHLPIDAGIYS